MSGPGLTVGTQAEFNNAIETLDGESVAGTYTVTLSGDIKEGAVGQPGGLFVLTLQPGVDVMIDGAGHSIKGGGVEGGIAVTTGHVSIVDVTFDHTAAIGGGGGAGLGGGLFVGPDAVVDISGVQFVGDSAKGAKGSSGGAGFGGPGGNSNLIYPAVGGGGTNGTAGAAGAAADDPGGDGGDGHSAGIGVAGGQGGSGGEGGQPSSTGFGEAGGDGGNGGKGGAGGIGGVGGFGGPGGGGGSGQGGGTPGQSSGDAGNGGDGGDAANGGFGGGGGGGGPGSAAGRGNEGVAGTSGPSGDSTDGGSGGKGGDGGDASFGGGGGGGGHGGDGGGGGTGANPVVPANGGPGGSGGKGGNGDFGGGGGGGGAGGNGGRAGAGISIAPGSPGSGGAPGKGGEGGFGAGFGAPGQAGFSGPTASSSHVPSPALNGAGGGGLGAGGGIFVAEGGQLTVDGGLLSGGTVAGGASGGRGAAFGSAFGSGIFIQGNDTVTLAAPGGKVLQIKDVIADQKGSGGTGAGGLVIGAGGTVDLAATDTFTGGITITAGTLDLSAIGAAGSGTIDFAPGSDATLEFNAADVPTNQIAGLSAVDFIAVPDKTIASSLYTPLGGGGTLNIGFAGGGDVTLTIQGSYLDSDFSIQHNEIAVDAPPCFVAGTRILTEAGEIDVEALCPGDRVRTSDGVHPVVWIGHRRVALAAHPRPEEVRPIRIRRGAFADGIPHRDLLVSPDHAVFVNGHLICARLLANGGTIAQDAAMRAVTYYHVELDAHAILFAERLPTESYLDTGNRGSFDNAGLPVALHPDLTGDPARRGGSCVPFAVDAATVEPVWRRLAARSAVLGYAGFDVASADDPDLCLLAGTQILRPVASRRGRHVFVLPADAASVRIVSRAARPCATRPWLDDRRRLGVRVGRIRLTGAAGPCDVALDDPALGGGWHEPRRERWTDGCATLALPKGTAMVAIDVAATVSYPLENLLAVQHDIEPLALLVA